MLTDGQTDRRTDAGQSDPYVPLCFAGDTKIACPNSKDTICAGWRKVSIGVYTPIRV